MHINHINWTPQLVTDYAEESISTLRKMPAVTVKGYFRSLPGVIHTPDELMQMESRPIRLKATPDEISRLEQVLSWMPWLTRRERKLFWQRAARVPWKIICQELGCTHVTGWRKHMEVLNKISSRLNQTNIGNL